MTDHASMFRWCAALGLSALACTGSAEEPQPNSESLPFERSPIVFGSYDPLGTHLLTLERGKVEQLNTNYDPVILSPSRRRLLQVTRSINEVFTLVEVYDVSPNATRLGAFEYPGGFLGWSGDDVALFLAIGSGSILDGLSRIDVLTGNSREFRLPDWVDRRTNNIHHWDLSPDATAAAFVVFTKGAAFAPDGFALIVVDTETGEVIEQWAIPPALGGGQVIWAKDGTIIYRPSAEPGIRIADPQTNSLSELITLPFDVCWVQDWLTPSTLEVSERIIVGDQETCPSSWVVTTDGTSAEKRAGPSPVALSPDLRKVLLLIGDGELAIANPDGTEQTKIANIPKARSTPVW